MVFTVTVQTYHDDIRKAGLRPTPQRISIAKALFEELDHPTAEDVMKSLAARNLLVSQATVYNTLHAFVEGGLLQEVYLGDGRTVYDHNVAPHHHFIDEETQSVLDISLEEVTVSSACKQRFDIQSVQMVIRGKRKAEDGSAH